MINLTREEAQHILKLLDKFDMFNDFIDVREPLRAKLSEPKNEFNPDWNAMAVMVEEQQRMAKQIEELDIALAEQDAKYLDAVETLDDEGWTWDGDQWQRPATRSEKLREARITRRPRGWSKEDEPEPVAWKVWTVHNHIFFSIGVQTFQINDVLEHQPEVIAKEFSEWLATQLRHALTLLSTTPPQREYPVNFIDALKFHTAMQELEPEPVAWMHNFIDYVITKNRPTDITRNAGRWTPLYTAPPAKEWAGLTDDEYELMAEKRVTNYFFNTLDYAHDIEAKLKEKNT